MAMWVKPEDVSPARHMSQISETNRNDRMRLSVEEVDEDYKELAWILQILFQAILGWEISMDDWDIL